VKRILVLLARDAGGGDAGGRLSGDFKGGCHCLRGCLQHKAGAADRLVGGCGGELSGGGGAVAEQDAASEAVNA
jgi:hypothetical protein